MSVTLKDIAKKAGVTKATVSYALRNHTRIPKKTRDRIQQIAQDLGYQKNPMLASLSQLKNQSNPTHRGNLACIVGHDDSNPMSRNKSYTVIYKGLKERAEELNFAIDLFWAYDPHLQGKLLEKTLRSRSICGIALLAISEQELNFDWKQYAVAYATSTRKLSDRSFSHIQNNLAGTLELAIKKILDLGYRRIGLCIGEQNIIGSQSVFHGCLAYTRHTFNIPYPPDIPIFSYPFRAAPSQNTHKLFQEWYHRYTPEIIITEVYNTHMQTFIPPVAGKMGPQNKVVSLDLELEKHPEFAGIQIDYKARGRIAMDLIAEQIFSNHFGPPKNPKYVIMNSFSWIPGKLKPSASIT